MSRSKLIIYNLETDLDSNVLASGVSWIEELSIYFDEIHVYSTYVGRFHLPPNVTVSQIGGGSFLKRIVAVWLLYKSTLLAISNPSEWAVFHHMSSRTCMLLGLNYRIFRVRQVLWYSHNHASLDLVLGYRFMDHILTPTPTSFPLKSSKVRFVGHAVKIPPTTSTVSDGFRSGIISLGRVAKVKNLDLLLDTLKSMPEIWISKLARIAIVGPNGDDAGYSKDLIKGFDSLSIDFKYFGALNQLKAQEILRAYSIYFTGTPKSVDKATIEAAMSGCLIVSESPEAIELTGMIEIWKQLGVFHLPDLQKQISTLLFLSEETIKEFRIMISELSRNKNGLNKTMQVISSKLKD